MADYKSSTICNKGTQKSFLESAVRNARKFSSINRWRKEIKMKEPFVFIPEKPKAYINILRYHFGYNFQDAML